MKRWVWATWCAALAFTTAFSLAAGLHPDGPNRPVLLGLGVLNLTALGLFLFDRDRLVDPPEDPDGG